jgi:hypothetical protein
MWLRYVLQRLGHWRCYRDHRVGCESATISIYVNRMRGVLTLYQISEFDWRLNRVDVEVLDRFSLVVAGTFDLAILIILF